MNREELLDVIADALSDSIDLGMRPAIGASYVLDALLKEGVVMLAPPDLLKALKALHAVAEMTTFSDQFPGECEAARAAIATATGEAS